MTKDKDEPWPRDRWMDAVWECEALNPSQRAVLYAYYRFAGRADVSWCPWPELMRRTGIRSRDTVNRVLKQLVKDGWLTEAERARQHRAARYKLTVPDSQGSENRTAEHASQGSENRTPEEPRGPILSVQGSDFASSEDRFSDPTTQRPTEETQTGGHAAPRTPLRGETPSGPRNEQASELPERGTSQLIPVGDPPHARTPARGRPTCPTCTALLDLDGSCFVCRTPARNAS